MSKGKPDGLVLAICGAMIGISIASQYLTSGCIRPSVKVEEVCGPAVSLLTMLLFLLFMGLPIGYIYDNHIKNKNRKWKDLFSKRSLKVVSKKTKILYPIAGVIGAIGLHSKYRTTGCIRFSSKFQEMCGSDVYWYYLAGMTFCLALPAGYLYEKYYRQKSIDEMLQEDTEIKKDDVTD